jgi:hypothetical protein
MDVPNYRPLLQSSSDALVRRGFSAQKGLALRRRLFSMLKVAPHIGTITHRDLTDIILFRDVPGQISPACLLWWSVPRRGRGCQLELLES